MPPSDNTKTALAVGAGVVAVGAGLYLATRKAGKKPGDTLTAIVRFMHQGRGEDIWVGIGYAPGKTLGHNPVVDWAYTTYTVPDEFQGKRHEVKLETKIPQLTPGKYDLRAFIQAVGGKLDPNWKGFKVVSPWYEDPLEVR